MTTNRPKVLIELKGGVICRITSTEDMQFMIFTHDAHKDVSLLAHQRQHEMLPHDLLEDKAIEIHNVVRPPAF